MDLASHTANGSLDGSKLQQWDTSKMSGDSNMSRSDGSRESNRRNEWWRSRKSRRDLRNGERETSGDHKDLIDSALHTSTSDAPSPAQVSPGRPSRTGKLKNFFKRKPRQSNDQEKQLSSFGSSSQLRTPPISDTGRSVNSDE
jgi:hypothetical protein